MKRNKKSEPLGDTRGMGKGNDETAMTGTLPLALDYITDDTKEQTLTLGRALRLRDAMITLERRLLEVRVAFEAEIAEVLKGGVA